MKRLWCLVLAVLVCASCDVQKMVTEVTPEQDLARAHHAFDLLRHHDLAALEAEYDPAARKADLEAKLEALAAKLPGEEPVHDTATSVQLNNDNGQRSVALMLLYQFPSRWVQFNINTQGDSPDAMAITSLDVTRLPIPPAPQAGGMHGFTAPVVLLGIALWLVMMWVIYRRYMRKPH